MRAGRGARFRVVDFDAPETNDWLAVNQFTVVENKHERRPDIVLFVNGLPLGVIELKNPTDENATIRSAFQQLQTYKTEIPSLFLFNTALIVSDGLEARIGTLTASWEWFKPWRTITGETLADPKLPQLQVLVEGVCAPRRLLAVARDFIVFEDDGSGLLAKKMAGYHQFHAVETAVTETLRATRLQRRGVRMREAQGRYESGRQPGGAPGDRRIGVVWHTQGSGKSLTMAFYAGRLVRDPAMENPTIVVLTDRNDLDDQLFGTFARCADLLRQPPVQVDSRADLHAKLAVQAGGVVFTTIQKFFPDEKGDRHPVLSERRNIVVIADGGASQPVRLRGRVRAAHARRPAERLVHRLHRHADRAGGREHPRRVRRPHQHLRHPAGGRGRRDRADLLREPPREAGARRAREAAHRCRLRGGDRRRGDRPPREAEDQVGTARGHRRRGEACRPRRTRHRRAFRESPGGDGR